MSPGHARRTLKPIAVLLALPIAMLVLAAPASAMKTSANATPKVQRWESPRAYGAPYALVRVIHEGKALAKAPINRCKGTYVSEDLAVMVSTCGHRWRVRARYVSMSGHNERFQIVYQPRHGS